MSRTGDPERGSSSLPTTAGSAKHAQHPASACPSGSQPASSRSQPIPTASSATDMLAYSPSTSSSSVSGSSSDSQSQAAVSEDQDDGPEPSDLAAPPPSSASGVPPLDMLTSHSCPKPSAQGQSLSNLPDDAISRASLPTVVAAHPSDPPSSSDYLAPPTSSDRASTSELHPPSHHTSSVASGPSGSSHGPAGLTMSDPRHAHQQHGLSARYNRPRLAQPETTLPTVSTGSTNNIADDLRSHVSASPVRSAHPAPAPAPIAISFPSYDRTEAHSPESPTNAFGPSSAPARVPLSGTATWEPDDATDECHLCSRQFTLFTRRHHCRSCGRVCCAQCTRRRAFLPKHLIVSPSTEEGEVRAAPGIARTRSVSTPRPAYQPPDDTESEPVRVCDDCVEMGLGPPLESALALASPPPNAEPSASTWDSPATAQRIERPRRSGPGDQTDRNVLSQYFPYFSFGSSHPSTPQVSRSLPAQPDRSARRPPSRSAMLECPVCTRLVAPADQTEVLEAHIRACVESPTSALLAASGINTPNSQSDVPTPTRPRPTPMGMHYRYARDTLQNGNPLIGRECLICMEDFELHEAVARMACLCAYHESCLKGWFTRGVGCPTHRPPSPTPH